MQREWLERELAAGRSIEDIAREVGKDPSTVAYWVKKFGLESSHASRHAPRGGIPKEVLEELIEQGLSVRGIATRLDVSYATVQHWLKRHSLKTQRAMRRADPAAVADERRIVRECRSHGVTVFQRRSDGGYRCLRCRSEAVTRRRQHVKATLVAEAGGSCVLCGYRRYFGALTFHHKDPTQKLFHLSQEGVARSLARARDEARKCALVCANCHAEVEVGLATIPHVEPDPPDPEQLGPG